MATIAADYNAEGDRVCNQCAKVLPQSARSTQRYCDSTCRGRAKELRDRQTQNPERATPTLRRLVETGYADGIVAGEMNQSDAALLLGVTRAAVSKAMIAYRADVKLQTRVEEWKMDPTIAAFFPHDYIDQLREMGLDTEGTPSFDSTLDRICEAFWTFQHRYFTIGSRQQRMVVKTFHAEMLRELVIGLVFGTQALLLTPPRMGKSELLVRFYSWVLILFPNYQILWIGANTDLASQMLRKIKATFARNTLLRAETLPPGKRYGTKATAEVWNESEFILETRTDYTLKSPSFTALGSTSTVAGRDADLIGVDDLEERKTVATADLRQKSREKHAEIMERKEPHTGVATIASRQHLDDIPNHLLAEEGEDAWRILVYSAHSDDCGLDPEVFGGHDTNGCLLFPEIRNYRWLMKMKRETEALGMPGRYPLRYLQKAVPTEGLVFDVPLIREKCLDRSRNVGVEGLPGMRLIGGLDPAARGNQAAVCWGWTPKVTYLIDIEEQMGGGIAGALKIMRQWNTDYGLDTWIYEDNAQQVEFFRNKEFIELKAELGLTVLPHTTGKNKHDPELGISAMAPWYHKGRFNLPFFNEESRRKVNQLLRQLELWTTDGISKRGKADVKMASWFPFPRMKRWKKGMGRKKVKVSGGGLGSEPTGLDNLDQMDGLL